jgi:hypothetical protein
MWDEYFQELGKNFLGLKYLKSLMHADPDPGTFLTLNPGWNKFGSGINIPDPQLW